jgi:raffinose/stachyose/melibiose transport system permease protein
VSWNGLGPITWAGLKNWTGVFSNSTTIHAMWLSLLVIVVTWVVQAPVSLLLGVFMAGQQRYRAFLSVLYFIPLLFSSAAIGIGFKAMLDPNFGLFSHVSTMFSQVGSWFDHLGPLSGIGSLCDHVGASLTGMDWLGNQLALWTVLSIVTWSFVPFHSLLYQAGVRQIPAALYEASTIDGASGWDQFWHITLPQLKYTVITSSTLMLVGALTYFDLFFVMTQGGPGDKTRILPLDMYLTGFRSFNYGKASAIAVILVVVGLVLSLTLNKLSGAQRMESQAEGM